MDVVINLSGANILNFFKPWTSSYKQEVFGILCLLRVSVCFTNRLLYSALSYPPHVTSTSLIMCVFCVVVA